MRAQRVVKKGGNVFEVKLDRVLRIITVRLWGWMDAAEAAACIDAREQAALDLGAPKVRHSTICDIREFRLHPQDVFALFGKAVQETNHKAQRIGVVVGEGTAKMQCRRIIDRENPRDNIRMFDDAAAAEAWVKPD